MDFDFGGSKKSQAKTGRRAKQTSMNTNERQPSAQEPVPLEEISNEGQNSPPRPSRRMAGWGDTGTGGRRREKMAEDSRLVVTGDSPRTRIHSSDEDDIQAIPDLDDVHKDDMTQVMAAPPSVAMNQVATYRELDSDLLRHSSFTLLDNEIDMKVLAKHMAPENEIREEDVTWEWERLFTEVSSGLKSTTKAKADIKT